MEKLLGYQDLSMIYESNNSIIYRARRERDEIPVILKMLRIDYPSPEEYIRYKQEYRITQLMKDVPGVIQTYGLETHQGALVIVLEDFGAESLNLRTARGEFGVRDTLGLAGQIVRALQGIHAVQIIHKDINPTNIILQPDSGQIKIIDFGISSLVPQEILGPQVINTLEGTLTYISPEQTGRTNRSVDYRTDYYSLGGTLYQLLTGQPPFVFQDAMELVHCHLARQPIPAHEINHQVPEMLSRIVQKLLAKNPEDRYQTARGILQDLEECHQQLCRKGRVDPFPIGARDWSKRLMISQKLYGREQELAILEEGLGRVSREGKELVLIAGPSGVGKTALVQELFKPLTLQQGTFITGKFESLQRDRPYTAFVSAFQQLLRQILTEPDEEIELIRGRLEAALGKNARVISRLMPELERIMGPQPEVEELPLAESQNRFDRVFRSFLGVFTRPEQPLLLFIDDLQWADAASLKWMEVALTSAECRSLYFIGAYRDNEVSPTHGLIYTVEQIARVGCPVRRIVLGPLSLPHVIELLVDTLKTSADQIQPLACLLQEKTQGNPFYLSVFLKMLWSEGLLTLDEEQGQWRWALTAIGSTEIADNVAELLSSKLRKLGPAAQVVLRTGACLGTRFNLGSVALLCGLTPREVVEALGPAVMEGLVLSQDKRVQAIEHEAPGLDDPASVEYRFAHDRIQLAAYQLIPETERKQEHDRIGRALRASLTPEGLEQRIFEVVNHLNLGLSTAGSVVERVEVARLNLVAGRRAKAAGAYGESLSYLMTGKELVGEAGWESDGPLMLALCEEGAESAYLSADFARLEALWREVCARSPDLLDQVKAHHVYILGQIAQNRQREAVEIGIGFLEQLGLCFPRHPTRWQLLGSFIKARLAVPRRRIASLVDLPEMADPATSAAVRVLRSIANAAFCTNPDLAGLLACQQVRMLIRYGNNQWSCTIFSSFAIVVCGVAHDYETGYRLGQLALQLVDRYEASDKKCRTLFVVAAFVRHWTEPVKNMLSTFQEAFQIGVQTGDFEYAANSLLFCSIHGVWVGLEISALARRCQENSEELLRLRQMPALVRNKLVHQYALNLLGSGQDPCRLVGEATDEETVIPTLFSADDRPGVMVALYCKLVLCCYFQRFDEAVQIADLSDGYKDGIRGTYTLNRYLFYDSIARLRGFPAASRAEQRKILARVRANLRFMKKGTRRAPQNNLHMYRLVEAERFRVLGKTQKAAKGFRQAVVAAAGNGFLQEEGFIAELAAGFFFDQKKRRPGRRFLKRARGCYLRWGAVAKVQDVDLRFGRFIRRRALSPEAKQEAGRTGRIARSTVTSTLVGSHTTKSTSSSILDLSAVIKASQLISGEIELESLLHKLMQIVIENAGAEVGYLILKNEEQLTVEAWINGRDGQHFKLMAVPLSECAEVPVSMIRFVLRSNESLVLANACASRDFRQDAYVQRVKPKSVLCCPILRHGVVLGVLYLENNQVTDVFTPERVELLGVLASQAAISIDNARLYRMLKKALAQARESMQAKNELLARTSHELRTPLNAIINLPCTIRMGYHASPVYRCSACRGLYEGTPGGEESGQPDSCPACQGRQTLSLETRHIYDGDVAEVYQALDIIEQAGQKLLQIVSNLLDLSELESQRLQLSLDEIEVAQLVGKVLELVSPMAAKQDIRITGTAIPEDLKIRGDYLKLGRVLFNLLDNAIKFSPRGGEVSLVFDVQEREVCFRIGDRGIGIAEKDRGVIFDSFRQVEEGATRRYGGAGLGLSIAKSLVELHEGNIEVVSELGRGSTFLVHLPRDKAGDRSDPPTGRVP